MQFNNIFLSIPHKPHPMMTCPSFFLRNNNFNLCLLQLKLPKNFRQFLTKATHVFLKKTLMLNLMILPLTTFWIMVMTVKASFFPFENHDKHFPSPFEDIKLNLSSLLVLGFFTNNFKLIMHRKYFDL